MAYIKTPKTEEELKKMPISSVRSAYLEVASDLIKIIDSDFVICPYCGEPKARINYYTDKSFAIGVYPECKECVLAEVEQRKTKKDKPNETKESVQKVLQKMNLPYIDELYENSVKMVNDENHEKNRKAPFLQYLVSVKSLPQYRGKIWIDSEFPTDSAMSGDVKVIQKTIKSARKRFGSGYTDEELMFIENEYQDWITRYECNTKAQENLFELLSLNKLERKRAVREGKSTKELDKTFQDLLAAQNIQPRQSSMDATSDAQTFGTLIQKYEETRPLPEIDPELEDVDKIGLYIDAFYRGHASKMLGLKNKFSHIYEKVMSKYTVTPPRYDEEEDSEVIFDKIFGSVTED